MPSTDQVVARDPWYEVRFKPVTTRALRLNVELPDEWAAVIHERQVSLADDELE